MCAHWNFRIKKFNTFFYCNNYFDCGPTMWVWALSHQSAHRWKHRPQLYWAPQSSDMLYPLGSTKNLRNKSLQDLQLAKSGANSPSSPNSSSSRPRQGNLFVQYTMLEKIWRISLYVLLESLVESRCTYVTDDTIPKLSVTSSLVK